MNTKEVQSADRLYPDLRFDELLSRHPELQIARDDYNINVTANYGITLTPEEVFARHLKHDGSDQPTHLYFHVPLCSYICHFCNYVKQLLPGNGNEDQVLDRWTGLLIEESSRYLKTVPWIEEARIESFYIGGGTAALLREPDLFRLMAHVRRNYRLVSDCELTLEGNPENFTRQHVQAAMGVGFNRFSVGVQSFQDEVNQFTGRKHDGQMSLQAINNLKESGCPFNVDMMFGLPLQTPDSVAEDVRLLTELKVPTITIYRLRNADRDKMGIGNRAIWNIPNIKRRLDQHGVFPTLLQTYAMREEIVRILIEHDYYPSPCGWWNAPNTYPNGNIPRVSKNKWERYDTMLAYGPGAYGWLTGNNAEIVQTHNNTDIAAYARHVEQASGPPLAPGRLLRGNQAVASALGFAIKANQPILIERFQQQFGVDLLNDAPYCDVIETLLDQGFLEKDDADSTLKLTLEGEALHEELITVYIHNKIGMFSEPTCRRSC
jgi:oxygen-independent coproporphyrinogen-3 oxidase